MGSNMGVDGRVYIQTKRNRSIEYLDKRMDVDTARQPVGTTKATAPREGRRADGLTVGRGATTAWGLGALTR